MTLLVMFSLTLITFFLGYRSNNPKLYLISFAASGVAVLTKGPIGFFFAGADNFNLPRVAGRLETFAEALPREKFFCVRSDCRAVVFADDLLARRGVRRKFFWRAQLPAGNCLGISENRRVVLLRADFGDRIFPVVNRAYRACDKKFATIADLRHARKIFARVDVDGYNFLPAVRDEIRDVHIARDDSRRNFRGTLPRQSVENFSVDGGRVDYNFPVAVVHSGKTACRRQFRQE